MKIHVQIFISYTQKYISYIQKHISYILALKICLLKKSTLTLQCNDEYAIKTNHINYH